MTVDIVSRAAWGARFPAGAGPAPLPAAEVWLHHSVTIAPDLVEPFDDDDAAMRLLELIGQERFRQGVSYTFAVMPSGRVYEGHGVATRGAHTKGRNDRARAIVLVGNYDAGAPTPAQVESTAQLLVDGVAEGWWTTAELDGGHQQAPGASTACPGRHAMAAIPTINARASQLARGGTPSPAREGTPDMRALRTPDGTLWLATELEVNWTRNLGLAQSVAKVHNPGGTYIECTREEVEELRKFTAALRAQRKADFSADVDEAELASTLAPLLVDQVDKLSAADLGALAGAVATEAGRRLVAPTQSFTDPIPAAFVAPAFVDYSDQPTADVAAADEPPAPAGVVPFLPAG